MIVMFNSLRAHTPQSLDLNPYEMLFTQLFLIIFFTVRKCRPCIRYYDVSDQHWSTYLQLRKTTLMLRPNLNAFINCEMPSPWKTDSHSWIVSSCNPCSLIKWGYEIPHCQTHTTGRNYSRYPNGAALEKPYKIRPMRSGTFAGAPIAVRTLPMKFALFYFPCTFQAFALTCTSLT